MIRTHTAVVEINKDVFVCNIDSLRHEIFHQLYLARFYKINTQQQQCNDIKKISFVCSSAETIAKVVPRQHCDAVAGI